jgi:atlastin
MCVLSTVSVNEWLFLSLSVSVSDNQADQENMKQTFLEKTAAHACCSPADISSSSTATTATHENEENSSASEDSSPAITAVVTDKEQKDKATTVKKPFQRLQFLVRDWQNFSKDYTDKEDSAEWFQEFKNEMQSYIDDVLRDRQMSDLQSTREQIVRCFEKVDCFLLPHPGPAVTKLTFDGLIQKIDPDFRSLVNRYVRLIFDEELEPKEVNHRQITGRELKAYFEVYAKMFQTGEKTFPKAMTMLDATAEANNRNATDIALAFFKANMELLVGEGQSFVKEIELNPQADKYMSTAMKMFDEIATMGSPTAILKCRQTLVANLEAEKQRYLTTNALRNPFRDIEFFVVPLVIALGAWFLSVVTDKTCSTDFCERVEDTFVNVYLFVFFAVLLLAWKQVRGIVMYMKDLAPLVMDQLSKKN